VAEAVRREVVQDVRDVTGSEQAWRAASRASVRASSGWRMRDAATTSATSTPCRALACRASSRMMSSAADSPPTYGA
jgi:hypothetical protein